MKVLKKSVVCKCGKCPAAEAVIGLSIDIDTLEDLPILNAVLDALERGVKEAGASFIIEDEFVVDRDAASSRFIN